MKRILFGLACLVISIPAFSNSGRSFFSDIWNFMAPIVVDRTNTSQVPNRAPGLIIYDTTDEGFYGRKSDGTWAVLGGGNSSVVDVCLLKDSRIAGADSGTFTSGSWQTRRFDSTPEGDCSWLTIGSTTSDANMTSGSYITQLTLSAGTYLVDGEFSAYRVDGNKARLYSVTNNVVKAYGNVAYSGAGSTVATSSHINYYMNVTGSETFKFEHKSNVTGTTSGFGMHDFSDGPEIYSQLKIIKLQ